MLMSMSRIKCEHLAECSMHGEGESPKVDALMFAVFSFIRFA